MHIDKDREIVTTSAMRIPERLKSIDKGYFIVRNHQIQKFEVHHREQIGDTFCLILPYEELDARTLQYVKDTQIENARSIIEEIEKKNRKLEEDASKKVKEYAAEVTKDIYSYVNNHESKDTVDFTGSKLYKNIAQ